LGKYIPANSEKLELKIETLLSLKDRMHTISIYLSPD
jgi:hypothetical protein